MTDRAICQDLLDHRECRDLRVFSWMSEQLESRAQCGERCECEDRLTYTVHDGFETELRPLSCDETAEVLGQVKIASDDLLHFLRLLRQCESWGGYHAGHALLSTNLGEIAAEMYGVDGLAPEYGENCCQIEDPETHEIVSQSRGTLIGMGRGDLEGCSLVAAYTARYPQLRASEEPCDNALWQGWDLHLTGVLACPCRG